MDRYCYYNSVTDFLIEDDDRILGLLTKDHEFSLVEEQRDSWIFQIKCLKRWLKEINGTIIFEYTIPRMGRRIDCVLLCQSVVFAIEFKVGAKGFDSYAVDQVVDYALDLKNFHSESHDLPIVPILICTKATDSQNNVHFQDDGLADAILTNGTSLARIINSTIENHNGRLITPLDWVNSTYKPTPTIIQAAQALYRGHRVEEISRSDAGAINLSKTTDAISAIIEDCKSQRKKIICFLTGVPGAGKTLAGLNIANSRHKFESEEHAVFLSGNGPLVDVLREALSRNEFQDAKAKGLRIPKSKYISTTKAFIQNIHHFRDDNLRSNEPPIEKVVIFDEAQRAWTLKQTASFMKAKKGIIDFDKSEPEFLISVMDRHEDWATIICLVGGGQEINTGEAGLQEWFNAIRKLFSTWEIHISSNLSDFEYTRGNDLFSPNEIQKGPIRINDDLHLSVSVRSFRSEKISAFVKSLLDIDISTANKIHKETEKIYPILLTRDLNIAKKWLRKKARGSERYGVIASSGGLRLKPCGINVKVAIDPKYWFLNSKNDVRSSYFLEDIATEFDIQGLELDWSCVAWDANLRFEENGWDLKSFSGTAWREVRDPDARIYLINSYRVLLTRSRQGMIIFVPEGDASDPTRLPEFYDKTYDYFRRIGIRELKP